MVDRFDEAVFSILNPTSNGSTTALEYLNRVKESEEGWKFCLEKFYSTTREEIKLVSLRLFQELILFKFDSFSDFQRDVMKKLLWRYLVEVIPNNQETPAIKNKYAQTLILFFKGEYSFNRWNSFVPDVLSTLSIGLPSLDMFLRILRSFDEEVVDLEMHRTTAELAINVQIKDFIRSNGIKEIVDVWYKILETCQTDSRELCNECLDIMSNYISWIDINLILNERFITLFYKFLLEEDLQENACYCLCEIIDKGMDPLSKVNLISMLKLDQVLANIPLNSNIDFLESVAELINVTGKKLLEALTQFSSSPNKPPQEVINSTSGMLENTTQYLLKFLNCKYNSVSSSLLDFTGCYLNSLKQLKELNQQLQFLGLLLQTIGEKIKYPLDFDFSKRGEEDQEFREFRHELSQIFKTILKLAPQPVIEWIGNLIQSIINTATTSPASITFADIEGVLTLFYFVGETTPTELIKNMEPFFSEMISKIISSNLSMYPHETVTLIYFDNVTRYSKYLLNDPEVLKLVLISFLDERGIRNGNTIIKSRACYLFLRFIKSQLSNIQPFLPSILKSLSDILLTVPPRDRQMEDLISLCEGAGVLIGTLSPQDQIPYLNQFINPRISHMEQILQQEAYKTDTPQNPYYTNVLCDNIFFIGTFSKGFSNISPEASGYFKTAFQVIIKILTLLPLDEIKTKVFFFMHRMIECLKAEVLEFIHPVLYQLLLMNHCPSKDLPELIRLLNQLMSRFKELMGPIINELLIKILQRVLQEIQTLQTQVQPNSQNSEIQREILDLLKNYHLLLSTLIVSNLSHILWSQENLPHLDLILKTMVEGAESTDPSLSKLSFASLKKLIDMWSGESEKVTGFNDYVLKVIVPLLITRPLHDFNLNDAVTAQTLNEIIEIEILLKTKFGIKIKNHFVEYLQSLNWNPNVVSQFIQLLDTGNSKQLKEFWKSIFTITK